MNRRFHRSLARCFICAMASYLICSPQWASAVNPDWPGFRGPSADGHTASKDLPTTWSISPQKNIAWMSPLHGSGHASPIIANNTVIVCSVFWPPDNKQQAATMPEHHVTAYDLSTGKENWNTQIEPGNWRRQDFRSGQGGGYASCTPVTDGNTIYCVFGSSVIVALDFKGKLLWRKPIAPNSFDVAIGASPILYNDTILMLCSMAKSADSSLTAFDKKTGEIAWRKNYPDMGFAHSTPLLIQRDNTPELILLASGINSAPKGLRAVNPATGDEIWWCKAAGDASSPAFANKLIYCDSGRGGKGIAVQPAGQGDQTANIKWTTTNIPEAISSPLIHEGRLYRLHNPGIVKCFDLADGKELFSQRLPNISSTWASPIVDGNGNIFFASAGKSVIIQSAPQYKLIAENDLADPNHPSPAVAPGKLILVGAKNIYCIANDK